MTMQEYIENNEPAENLQHRRTNPYKISDNWEAFYFEQPNGGLTLAIVDEDSGFNFGSAGMPLSEITEDKIELVAQYLAAFDCNVTFQSFKSILEAAISGSTIEINYRTFLELRNYLSDRAVADPRAKQLLAELEA